MKYCQGPSCHEYKTKDRIRGSKGDKHYETRKQVITSSRFVRSDVITIGSISLAILHSITSAEYTSLKELVAIVHGIRVVIGIGIVEVMISITSSMIYLVNAFELHNNNTMSYKLALINIGFMLFWYCILVIVGVF